MKRSSRSRKGSCQAPSTCAKASSTGSSVIAMRAPWRRSAFIRAPTVQSPLGGGTAGAAVMRVLSGSGAGRELSLQKVVTTIGKPGLAVAAVTRRLHGYVVAPIDGETQLNGEPLGSEAVALQDGDVLELGGTQMQFVIS